MEKFILRQLILLFLLAGIFNSCMTGDQLILKEKVSPEVIDVKLWYEKQKWNNDGFRMALPNGIKVTPLWPNWTMAFSEEDEQCKYMGFNLEKRTPQTNSTESDEYGRYTVGIIGTASPESSAKYRETNDPRYLASTTRLVIRTNKETNEKHAFVMMAHPDLSYIEMHPDDPINHITYLNRGEKFNGFVIFYELDGNFSAGWRYTDGKAYALMQRSGVK